jgi:hypothetical protein
MGECDCGYDAMKHKQSNQTERALMAERLFTFMVNNNTFFEFKADDNPTTIGCIAFGLAKQFFQE